MTHFAKVCPSTFQTKQSPITVSHNARQLLFCPQKSNWVKQQSRGGDPHSTDDVIPLQSTEPADPSLEPRIWK